MSKICLLLIHLPWLTCAFCCPFLTIFWFPFPLWLALLRGWTLLDGGLCLSSTHPFFLLPSPAIPLYHSCCEVFCLNPTGSLWACLLFFSQWPSTTIGSFITSLAGSCVPFVFSWASLAHLLSLAIFLILHSHGLLLSSLDFLGPIALSIILGAHGLAITLYFLCFHYFEPIAAHSHFSTSHTAHGLLFSLFPGSFKPIYPFTAHLFIS